jgi:hypothetical protein
MMGASGQVALYLDPPSHHFLQNRLFEADERQPTGDRVQEPYAHLKRCFEAKGVAVNTADYLPESIDSNPKIYISLGMLHRYRALSKRPDVTQSAFFAVECPIVEPSIYQALPDVQAYFKRLYSWSDSASLERFSGQPLRLKQFVWPQVFDDVYEDLWSVTKRKFLVMINANKLPRVYWNELYTERMRAVEFFGRRNEIDLFGVGWNGPPYRVGRSWIPYTFRSIGRRVQSRWYRFRPNPLLTAAQRAYRGHAASKSRTLGSYTFALCFENAIIKGWITEKIFDCFSCGTIPIYWGAPEITDYIPAECFIDRRKFSTYDDLRNFLHFLTETQIREYKENAREFIRSEKFRRFSKEAFVNIFREIVYEDVGIDL